MSVVSMDKTQLIEEFKKCKDDPVYFISNYVKVTHPVRGLVPFKLYPFQKDILKMLKSIDLIFLENFVRQVVQLFLLPILYG